MSQRPAQHGPGRAGFSLLELVIVIVILGVIAAIAIPRISRGVAGAEIEALRADLRILREAIELYAVDHEGKYPPGLSALTKYTSVTGVTAVTKTLVYNQDPYLRAIPPCPTGPRKGATGWAAPNANPPTLANTSATVGWLYHAATGGVWVNDADHFDM